MKHIAVNAVLFDPFRTAVLALPASATSAPCAKCPNHGRRCGKVLLFICGHIMRIFKYVLDI